jgi:hypothetical protein
METKSFVGQKWKYPDKKFKIKLDAREEAGLAVNVDIAKNQ